MGESYKELRGIRFKHVMSDISEERKLEKMHQDRERSSIDEDLRTLGEYCFSHPEKMDELDEKILNNRSFIVGLERAKRLASIPEIKKNIDDEKKRGSR